MHYNITSGSQIIIIAHAIHCKQYIEKPITQKNIFTLIILTCALYDQIEIITGYIVA